MPSSLPSGRLERGAIIGWLVDAIQRRLDPRTNKWYRYSIDWDARTVEVAGGTKPLSDVKSIWITQTFGRRGQPRGTLSILVGDIDLVEVQTGTLDSLDAWAERIAADLGCPIRRTNY